FRMKDLQVPVGAAAYLALNDSFGRRAEALAQIRRRIEPHHADSLALPVLQPPGQQPTPSRAPHRALGKARKPACNGRDFTRYNLIYYFNYSPIQITCWKGQQQIAD